MPRPPRNPRELFLLLQAQGPTPTRAIRRSLGISAATLSRLVAEAGPLIERIGTARNTRYALRRPVRQIGDHWPVYRIDERGRGQVWGELRALHRGFRFVPANSLQRPAWLAQHFPQGLFDGLPFFLQDVRPQGYVGRAIARESSTRLGVPADPTLWSDDDALTYFVLEGSDLPGDIVVGDLALEQALRRTEAIGSRTVVETEREVRYPLLADAAQRGELVGSSAGGEQTKFLVDVLTGDGRVRCALVKFSATITSPVAQRWADLLICEHLAAETLRARSVPCASTQLLRGGERCFLEVERYDRPNGIGRRGIVTLGALEDALVEGTPGDWLDAARRFLDAGLISPAHARALQWRWCFGNLIANTDMHRANVSFWLGDELPFALAPAYDMLPMLYAPGAQGELGERIFAPRPPLPAIADVWSDAAAAAADFWVQVVTDERISTGFRAIGSRCAAEVARLREHYR